MRLATTDEIERWDELIRENPDGGNALQTLAWGDFKHHWGWEPQRYILNLGGREVAVQFLARRIPLVGEIWYVPKGPGISDPVMLSELISELKDSSIPAIFIKIEPEILHLALGESGHGLVKAARDLQSKSTIFIDLKPSEDELLASFNQTARRNLRKAEAGMVVIEAVEATQANLDTMFKLMATTEARAHYGLRPKAYFQGYWTEQINAKQGQLFFATHDGEVLAGLFASFIGKRAWYKDGGSFNLRRELNASYAIQWGVMRWLKQQGIESYDLVGVPNPDQIGMGDERQGLYDFKAKFNPEITEFMGCWDLPLQPKKYFLWLKVGERLAARFARRRPEKFLY
jgi:lipid II:glycine glycyltransferase (peptidoglycan interpeptide bridge formation enzyme)